MIRYKKDLTVIFLIMIYIVAIISRRIDKLPITTKMIFIFVRIFIGWLFIGFIDVRAPPIPTILLLMAKIALVLILFTDASKVKLDDIKLHSLTTRLLSIGLISTIILGIAAAVMIFTDLTLWEAAIIGGGISANRCCFRAGRF